MSRRTTVAGLLGCALLAAPVASSSQGPTALQPEQAAAETVPTATSTATTDVPLPDAVVVPAATGARSWASGAAPTGVAPDRLSSVVLDAYTRAAALAPERCHLTVPLLAAIGQVESGNLVGRAMDEGHRVTPALVGPRLDGGAFTAVADTDKGQLDGDRKFDRALGPLQFLPSTWRSVGVDLDADGTRDPQSIYDAAGGAMVYLCGEGRDLAQDADLRDAVLSYNRSQAYLSQVLRWKTTFDAAELDQLTSMPAFSSWAVSTPVEASRVDVAEAVRPVPVGARESRPTSTRTSGSTGSGSAVGTPSRPTPSGPASPGTPGATPSAPGTSPSAPGTTPSTPGTTPSDPATPGTSPSTPATPTTPATPGGTPSPSDPAGPAPTEPGSPTPTPDPKPTPDPTPTPDPEPTPAPAVPALADLPVCVEPDPALPEPAPVDAATHPQLTLGEAEGTVVLPDGTLVRLEQLCQGTPAA
ncbi:lytic transglycosylase domain-containing protein [Nocardioides aurantiacus]|uniref:Membrane-bound lytic murein transglycosylase B n=1 Tax=Nocardioides aurantiacus TaxID=86796 RepID=A0A3N2CXT8_9ACTN|nr:lytic transglycosylase domain-containing protein [Nocardioides aurantiacus]ROR92273.1 membrane-bound lytic murein transglycosylase B [Nocardioides aurantiacus]